MIVSLFLCSVILRSELYFTAVAALKHFIYKVNDDDDDYDDGDEDRTPHATLSLHK